MGATKNQQIENKGVTSIPNRLALRNKKDVKMKVYP
jgi:hypothetical protein